MLPNENPKEQERKLDQLDYPSSEDIYNQDEAIPLSAEETPEYLKETSEEMGSNLDVPGSELDDDQQQIGSEDEENNYWSLGGDNHEDLETPEDLN